VGGEQDRAFADGEIPGVQRRQVQDLRNNKRVHRGQCPEFQTNVRRVASCVGGEGRRVVRRRVVS
jgi:hypothetical protein